MPLVEYVGFMLDLNTLHERDKLQRMQNKALCMCFNPFNPIRPYMASIETLAIDMTIFLRLFDDYI